MMLKHNIPEQFTQQYEYERAKLVADFSDVFTANITEKFLDITAYQLADGHIMPPTAKNRKTQARRWAKVLAAAGVDNCVELNDSARRHHFIEVYDSMIQSGEVGSTPGAILRSIEYFGEMLRTLQFDRADGIVKSLKNKVKAHRLVDEPVEPYDVLSLKNFLEQLLTWVDDRKAAPSLNDRTSAGKRTRAPSEAAIYRLAASVAMALASGGRLNALLDIRADDVDMATGTVSWARFKGEVLGQPMMAHLDDWMMAMVEPWVAWRQQNHPNASHFFVVPRTGNPVVNQEAMTMPLKRALTHTDVIAEGERGGFHRFRHTHACAALQAGLTPGQVAMALGNTEGMIRRVYGRFVNGKVGQATRQVLNDQLAEALDMKAKGGNLDDAVAKAYTEAQTILAQSIHAQAQVDVGMLLPKPSVHFPTAEDVEGIQDDGFEGTEAERRDLTPGSAYFEHMLNHQKGHSGADCGARTHDLGINSPTLHQLS